MQKINQETIREIFMLIIKKIKFISYFSHKVVIQNADSFSVKKKEKMLSYATGMYVNKNRD